MNRRPPGLKLEKTIQGFLQFKAAAGLSKRTIESYASDLRMWLEYQGDTEIARITHLELRQYLNYMLNEYRPRRLTGNNDIPLSPKTVRNIWVTLSALFRWVSEEFDMPNPMKKVVAPKFERRPVDPFSQEDVEALLKACDFCEEAQTITTFNGQTAIESILAGDVADDMLANLDTETLLHLITAMLEGAISLTLKSPDLLTNHRRR